MHWGSLSDTTYISILLCIYKIIHLNQWRIQDFPLGGALSHWGAPTSDVGAFQRKHMRKRKNWILLGGGGGHALVVPPPGSTNDLLCNVHSTLHGQMKTAAYASIKMTKDYILNHSTLSRYLFVLKVYLLLMNFSCT